MASGATVYQVHCKGIMYSKGVWGRLSSEDSESLSQDASH